MMLLPVVAQRLAQTLEPWQSLFSNSKVLPTVVTAIHLLALLFGGGLAVAADRATLHALRGDVEVRRRALSAMESTHRPVLIALAVLFISGVMLAAADVKTFLTTPVFYIKLALVALLLVNGAVLTTTEWALTRATRAGSAASTASLPWGRLRVASWASLFLWTATLVAGVALTNAS